MILDGSVGLNSKMPGLPESRDRGLVVHPALHCDAIDFQARQMS